MTSWASDLLETVRGRHLCLAAAARVSDAVGSAWTRLSWHQGDPERLADLIGALEAVDPGVVQGWTDPLEFHLPMDSTVSAAMGWQPPNEHDFVAAFPALTAALRPIARAVGASPAAAWWSAPVDLERLRVTARHDDDEPPVVPVLVGAAAARAEWLRVETADDKRARRERPADVSAAFSGHWWSTPGWALPTTTRALPAAGSVQLLWEEDGFGQREALVRPVRAAPETRVYEIDGPQAWVELVRRHPLDLTWSRRHDWYRVTGEDRRWLIPDWDAVGQRWDAVHLSVLGWLTTATRLLEVGDGSATLLAGWDPDETWWLADVLVDDGAPELWTQTDEFGQPDDDWRRLPS